MTTCKNSGKPIRLVSAGEFPGERDLWRHETLKLSCQLFGEPVTDYSYDDVIRFISWRAGKMNALQ